MPFIYQLEIKVKLLISKGFTKTQLKIYPPITVAHSELQTEWDRNRASISYTRLLFDAYPRLGSYPLPRLAHRKKQRRLLWKKSDGDPLFITYCANLQSPSVAPDLYSQMCCFRPTFLKRKPFYFERPRVPSATPELTETEEVCTSLGTA